MNVVNYDEHYDEGQHFEEFVTVRIRNCLLLLRRYDIFYQRRTKRQKKNNYSDDLVFALYLPANKTNNLLSLFCIR